jgi:SAP domain
MCENHHPMIPWLEVVCKGHVDFPCAYPGLLLHVQADLQAQLTQRGLDTSGTKPVLIDRLWDAISADAEVNALVLASTVVVYQCVHIQTLSSSRCTT